MSASAHAHEEHGEHISSLKSYLVIFGILLVLTVVTVGVSRLGLPSDISIMVAIGVACVKAFFVAGWFMHLKWDTRFNLLVFLGGFWFMLVFFGFTLTDLGSRGNLIEANDNFSQRADMGAKYAEPAHHVEGSGGHH
ncbi:MAG: cytochrome C oxidase subunit IV family protein [Alphaproteobacteria bacterium]|nr:cytochrome C oxidase subunit IV family protein [Alphaproteobacteria bacterium]